MKKTLFLPIILLASGMAQTVLSEDAKEPVINMENIPGDLYPFNNECKKRLNRLFDSHIMSKETINKSRNFTAMTTNISRVIKHDPRICAFAYGLNKIVLDRIAMTLKKDANNQPLFANLIVFGHEERNKKAWYTNVYNTLCGSPKKTKEAAIIASTFHRRGALPLLQRQHDLENGTLERDYSEKYKSTGKDVLKACSEEELIERNKKLEEEQIELLKDTKAWAEKDGYTLCTEAGRCETDSVWEALGIHKCQNHNLVNYAKNLVQ